MIAQKEICHTILPLLERNISLHFFILSRAIFLRTNCWTHGRFNLARIGLPDGFQSKQVWVLNNCLLPISSLIFDGHLLKGTFKSKKRFKIVVDHHLLSYILKFSSLILEIRSFSPLLVIALCLLKFKTFKTLDLTWGRNLQISVSTTWVPPPPPRF